MIFEYLETIPRYRIFEKDTVWDITASSEDLSISFTIDNEMMMDVVRDRFDYFSEIISSKLKEYAESEWDSDIITDEEKRIFEKVLGMII